MALSDLEHDCGPDLGAPSDYLLWTRMQAEAGQALELILRRKERERQAGDGRFFWGVGNAPAVIINSLARAETRVSVVFSRMKTKPKSTDRNPSATVIWRQYIDCEGKVRPLPPNALVTSRGDSTLRRKRAHYALECFSASPLKMMSGAGTFDPSAYRNASGTGAPVGSSQVTSLLVPIPSRVPNNGNKYTVDMTAALMGSYWVRLVDPLSLSQRSLDLVNCADTQHDNWVDIVKALRQQPNRTIWDDCTPPLL